MDHLANKAIALSKEKCMAIVFFIINEIWSKIFLIAVWKKQN
jgi:hypothetical protein